MSGHVVSSSPVRRVDMTLQCSSIVQCHVTDHSQARLAEDVIRQGRAIPRTVRSVVG
jgi:hypothetical protein